METESKTKKNMDYSASAVNLTNRPEVEEKLSHFRMLIAKSKELTEKASTYIPASITAELECIQHELDEDNKAIRVAIEIFGSYQDIATGSYALKQRKVSISYDPKELRTKHPAEAALVIEETVNATKINGLIKGGLLDAGMLKTEGITKETESFAYIIR